MPEEQNQTPEGDEGGESGPKALRAALERKEAEARQYRGQLMETAFTTLKLDPSKGMGKVIAENFDGKPTVDAILQYAKAEWDWEPPDFKKEPTPGELVNESQNRVDSLIGGSNPAPPPSDREQKIMEAEEKGDWVTSMNLKSERLREIMGGK